MDQRDFYTGGEGTDIVFGGGGPDLLFGEPLGSTVNGVDFLVGGDGNDSFWTGPGTRLQQQGVNKIFDFAFGGEGDDVFIGSGNNDFLASTLGNDSFFGGDGDDLIAGGDSDDFFSGGFGNDQILGEDGNDIIYGGPGVDDIDGGPGLNTVYPDRIAADADGDGDVDGTDFLNWQRNFGTSVGASVDGGDVDANGVVDSRDLLYWQIMYGTIKASQISSATDSSEAVTVSSQDIQSVAQLAKPLASRFVDASIDFDGDAVNDIDGDSDGIIMWQNQHGTDPTKVGALITPFPVDEAPFLANTEKHFSIAYRDIIHAAMAVNLLKNETRDNVEATVESNSSVDQAGVYDAVFADDYVLQRGLVAPDADFGFGNSEEANEANAVEIQWLTDDLLEQVIA